MWSRRDWHQFFHTATRRRVRLHPPRPVALTGSNRLLPTAGFSLLELDDAGLTMEQAENLGLPVDAGRVDAHATNVTALRDFVRATRDL